jgi:hypothetical protein
VNGVLQLLHGPVLPFCGHQNRRYEVNVTAQLPELSEGIDYDHQWLPLLFGSRIFPLVFPCIHLK